MGGFKVLTRLISKTRLICMSLPKASCPDQVCVKHGFLSSKATPIVCLPNKIVILYSGSVSETVDAVAGGVS